MQVLTRPTEQLICQVNLGHIDHHPGDEPESLESLTIVAKGGVCI